MENKAVAQITLGVQSYGAMLLVLKLARSCVSSNSTFGNVLRYENAVDLDVLFAIETILELDGQTVPLELDYTGVSNVVVACNIVCKMFCCDAIDYVMKDLVIENLNDIARSNIISYATSLIKMLSDLEAFKDRITKLLLETENKIYPC